MNKNIGSQMHMPLIIAIIMVPFAAMRAQQSDAVDPRAIIERGLQTLTRLQTETASWTTVFDIPNASDAIHLRITQSANRRTVVCVSAHNNEFHELCRIDERDGKWYVLENGKASIFRPYEAPLPLPALYLFLAQSELRIADAAFFQVNRFESLNGTVATYRAPLPENPRRQLEQALRGIEQVRQQHPSSINPEIESQVSSIQELLDRGVGIDIDIHSGILLAGGAIGKRFSVKDFRWSPNDDSAPPPEELRAADDHTKSILEGVTSLDDLIMIAHVGAWRPGAPKVDTEMVIFNPRTGEVRRVPYPGPGTGPGCFAKDRRSVFLSAMVIEEGTMGLFQIDLDTGQLRRLGENALHGMTMFPTLSPDGRTLAAVTKTGQENELLEWQVCLIDVATGSARIVGDPMDTAFLSWLPDGSGLVLVTRKHRAPNLPSDDTIARLDLDGNVSPIRPGTWPIVLSPHERMVFLDTADNRWKTCDLSGEGEKVVGDGLPQFKFPALSPDARWLVMMRFDPATGPRPFYVEVETGRIVPITAKPGLWALPAWR